MSTAGAQGSRAAIARPRHLLYGCSSGGTRPDKLNYSLPLWNNGLVDLNEIFIFAKVVDTQSFTTAARELGLPKSTVSRKISQLEERLGAQLLLRTTRKLKLTEVGAVYYQRCARIAAELEMAEREVTEMQSEPRGLLRLTAPVEFGFLGDVAAEFLRRYPKVEFDIELTGRKVDLIEEGFDVAIRAGYLDDSTLVATKLGDAIFWLCASPAYLASRGTPRSIDELSAHWCVVFGVGQRRRTWRLREAGEVREVPIAGPIATNSLSMAHRAALAGLGIALLPPTLCVDDVASGQLCRLLEDAVLPQGALYAVYPQSRNLSVKVRTFVDFLREGNAMAPWTTTGGQTMIG